MGKVRDRFGGMGRFTGWLRGQKYTGVSLITALTCIVESILTGCITAWFGNSTTGNRRALQRVVRTARHIVGGELPSLQDIYTRRCFLHCLEHARKNFTHQGTCAVVM